MIFNMLKRFFCQHRQSRALREINNMSELELRDLGIGRSEIGMFFLNEKNPDTDAHWGNRYPECSAATPHVRGEAIPANLSMLASGTVADVVSARSA